MIASPLAPQSAPMTVEEVAEMYHLPLEQARAVHALYRTMGPGFERAIEANATLTVDSNESLVSFGERTFLIPETSKPIVFQPHQKTILELMFNPVYAYQLGVPTGWQTMMFSTIKKSGKTALAALAARWVCETWGRFNEVYSIANDKEQSRGRIYAKALQSVQLDPRFSEVDKGIPGYWRIIERDATHVPSGSYLRAVSNDYKGEAGSNPTATFWSELWGYTLEASRRLWDELTPVPTRPRSIRYVETYAGFEGESELLIKLYGMVTSPDRGARRLTREDLAGLNPPLPWPFDIEHDRELPLFINTSARSIAYWDTNDPDNRRYPARRLPWQSEAYYAAQAIEMRTETFNRLHNNMWVSPTTTFIPIEWWQSCRPLPDDNLPPLRADEPLVIAADASVSGDCTALVAVSRNPDPELRKARHTVVRLTRTFTPPPGGKLNYGAPGGFKETLKDWLSRYRIVQVAYDPYQLHDVMTELRDELSVWTRDFSQGDERMKADFGLYTDIRDRHILNDTNDDPYLADHLKNADARIAKGSNTKLRIVKRQEDLKIDNAVALSMANAECKRLLLD
jgi:hypothetical protein